MPDFQITDEDRLKFKQLLREAATDGTVVGDFIKSMFSYDSKNQGGNEDNKLSESELESFFEHLISKSIDKYYKENNADVANDPWTSGASFKGIKRGNEYLSTDKIEKDIKHLDESKSDIGHHHIPNEIDSTDSNGNPVDPLSVDVIPNLNASKITDGVITRPIQTTGRISRQDASDSDITSLAAGTSGTDKYYFNNVTSDHELKYELLDNAGNLVGALVTNINADGSVTTHLRSYNNAGKGQQVYNDITSGINKTIQNGSISLQRFYAVTDINAFYRGIKPKPAHLGIIYGVQTGIQVPKAGVTSEDHKVDFKDATSNNNIDGFKFTEAPTVILTVDSDADFASHISLSVKSKSTTSFTYRAYTDLRLPELIESPQVKMKQGEGTDRSTKFSVNWVAFGNCSY